MSKIFELGRAWLAKFVAENRVPDLKLSIKTDELPSKRGIAVEARTKDLVGLFCLWESGEADWDVMREGKGVRHKWGLRLDEHTLELEFRHFVSELTEYSG